MIVQGHLLSIKFKVCPHTLHVQIFALHQRADTYKTRNYMNLHYKKMRLPKSFNQGYYGRKIYNVLPAHINSVNR